MFFCSNQLHSAGVTNVPTVCQYNTEQIVGTAIFGCVPALCVVLMILIRQRKTVQMQSFITCS